MASFGDARRLLERITLMQFLEQSTLDGIAEEARYRPDHWTDGVG